MPNNKKVGDSGEQEVCQLVPCPNCRNPLVLLPPGFPMYDVQCSRCLFRAQVKSHASKPKASILGAGWDIYEKVLKAGTLPPPLIINYKWQTKEGVHHDIRFYPFITQKNIEKYQLSPTAIRANYRMFRYKNLDTLPHMQLYTAFYEGMLLPKNKPEIDPDQPLDKLSAY